MAREISKKNDLREKLYAEKEFVDIKILSKAKVRILDATKMC